MGNLHGIACPQTRRLILSQAATAAGLSALFVIVYGTCNTVSSLRHDVGTIFFAWERYIPLVPIFIVPYMSIDLFFVCAPFLCREKAELQRFAKRVTAGILIAGTFFIVMPLTLAVPRPQVEGWLGTTFNFLFGFDRPYNMFPSLHIILRTILARLYVQKTHGWGRIIVRVWFVLVGASTVLTYQHHVIDVVGGFAVAALIFYAIPDSNEESRLIPNRRIGFRYGMIFLLSLLPTIVLWPAGAPLLWINICFGLVASAYFGIGPIITRKHDGRIAWSARIVLAPWLLCQQLSLLYYKRRCDPWNEVAPNVLIGRKLSDREAADVVRRGGSAVLDMTCEFSEAGPFRQLPYCNIQVLDLTAPTREQLEQAARFIDEHARKGVVYVHCKIGYSRSAAAVAAYLLMTRRAENVEDAVTIIRRSRPSVVIREEIWEALAKYRCPGYP